MSTIDYLKTLNCDQLRFCRDKCDELIMAIEAEPTKVAWAVTDGSSNYGWFRTEDYPKAIKFIAKMAEQRWAESDKTNPVPRQGLNLSIRGERWPESEYNALFADGKWG